MTNRLSSCNNRDPLVPVSKDPKDHLASLRLDRLPPLVPIPDVAIVLGVSRQTIYHHIDSGQLVALRSGRRTLRVLRESLIAFVQRNVVGAE